MAWWRRIVRALCPRHGKDKGIQKPCHLIYFIRWLTVIDMFFLIAALKVENREEGACQGGLAQIPSCNVGEFCLQMFYLCYPVGNTWKRNVHTHPITPSKK